MGRLEWLTAMALGRGHYEHEVIQTSRQGDSQSSQLYNERGYPRNPETRRRERENVRAANEVMQVTGVVEDLSTTRARETESEEDIVDETLTGLRLMELSRYYQLGGVWGVIGLRRRILLFRPYSILRISDLLKQETRIYSIPHMLFWGLTPMTACLALNWTSFLLETAMDTASDTDDDEPNSIRGSSGTVLRKFLKTGITYITVHLHMFAILQQLNLIPYARIFPSLSSFVPFSHASPITLPPLPSTTLPSIATWCSKLLRTTAPLLAILLHDKVTFALSKIMYRPIYKTLPRPTGESMFLGIEGATPTMEYDTPDQEAEGRTVNRAAVDGASLRAPEGVSSSSPPIEVGAESNDEADDEVAHATLISFDVEATEAVETLPGTWSAELRSANEPKASQYTKYRVTGLTMLPAIMATEGLRDIITTIIAMPLEAFMVRLIGRDYRRSGGLGLDDVFEANMGITGFGNLIAALTFQVVATGTMWASFTIGTSILAVWRRKRRSKEAEKNASAS